MGSGSGDFFKPKNIAANVITGGLYTPYKMYRELTKDVPPPPDPVAPAPGTPPPTPQDKNPVLTAQQRAKRLSALRYGIQSTITNNPLLAPAQTSAPALKPNLGA